MNESTSTPEPETPKHAVPLRLTCDVGKPGANIVATLDFSGLTVVARTPEAAADFEKNAKDFLEAGMMTLRAVLGVYTMGTAKGQAEDALEFAQGALSILVEVNEAARAASKRLLEGGLLKPRIVKGSTRDPRPWFPENGKSHPRPRIVR